MRCVLILFSLFPCFANAQSLQEIEREAQKEFSYKLEYHELRYKDFFQRSKDKEAYTKQRLANAGEQKLIRREAAARHEKARADFVKNRKKKERLEKFLPEQLTEEEIEKVVVQTIDSIGASGMQDMGKVMGVVSKELAGQADGKTISSIVKAKLSS